MRDPLITELEWLTRGIRAIRITYQLNRAKENDMAIEIKGLKGKAIKAASVFDRMNRAYDKLIETGTAHAGDVEGLAPQIDAMQDDITFAAQTLGNSVAGSEQPPEPPKQATMPPPVDIAPIATEAPPAVGEQPSTTFPGQ